MIIKNIKFIAFIVINMAILLIPMLHIAINNSTSYSILATILTTFLLLLFLFSLYNIVRNISSFFVKVMVILLFLLFAVIRVILAFVYDFSGRGFSNEFFAHISWQSFKIGLYDYGIVFFIAAIALLIFATILFNYLNRLNKLTLYKNFGILIFAIIFLILLRIQVPEYRLFTAYNRYFVQAESLQLDKYTARAHAKDVLSILRNTDKLPVEKNQLVAEAPEKPKNIVIIYLESFSDILTNNDKYPNLTPNLDKLKLENISFENNFSSAYVTIEGIANSQCGTIMNMENDNNSLTTQAGRLPNLPCLGDILAIADYKQVFYGGADLVFAGKGAFLKEHGYDELKGKIYWEENKIGELNQWGLTDADLFNQALKKIKELHLKKQPFNLTMLTLGTHIPGFLYRGCTPYSGSNIKDKFLNAIHCTDFLLGQFIDRLKKDDLLKDTIVYIQGDHAIFPTHDMKHLFDEKTTDRRVLNIIIDKSEPKSMMDVTHPTSTLNLVTNVLDLLEISHNVNFIFAYSDFNKKNYSSNPYLITRYDDYFATKKINNASPPSSCDDSINLTLPLDNCEKQKALAAIYQLDASYSIQPLNQIACELGVDIAYENDKRTFMIQWGNRKATDLFYADGRLLKTVKAGLYLLELDAKDNILNQFFYHFKDRNGLRALIRYLHKEGSRFLLLNNLKAKPKSNIDLMRQLPQNLFKNNFFYGHTHLGSTIPFHPQNISIGKIKFTPASCPNGFKISNYEKYSAKKVKQVKFCAIEKWGPQKTLLGESFLKQPNGLSAFWIKTSCAPTDAVMRVNGIELKTVAELPVITASIDDKTLLNHVKSYTIDLFSPKSGLSQKVGDFIVLPNNNTPIKLKSFKRTKQKLNIPPLIAHATGGYKNQAYSNSLEALNYNYSLGHRFFEMDFNWTKDNQLVAIHDWKETYQRLFSKKEILIPTEKQFMQLHMGSQLSQINLSVLNEWLKNHPDAYIVTDIRGNNVKALTQMIKVMETAPNQIIPQLYHPINYDEISQLGYNNIIFTLYATHLPTKNLIEFIKKTPLIAITINPAKLDFKEIVEALKNTDVFIYVHTFNTPQEVHYYLQQGIDGVYTDFLYLDDNQEVLIQ